MIDYFLMNGNKTVSNLDKSSLFWSDTRITTTRRGEQLFSQRARSYFAHVSRFRVLKSTSNLFYHFVAWLTLRQNLLRRVTVKQQRLFSLPRIACAWMLQSLNERKVTFHFKDYIFVSDYSPLCYEAF